MALGVSREVLVGGSLDVHAVRVVDRARGVARGIVSLTPSTAEQPVLRIPVSDAELRSAIPTAISFIRRPELRPAVIATGRTGSAHVAGNGQCAFGISRRKGKASMGQAVSRIVGAAMRVATRAWKDSGNDE